MGVLSSRWVRVGALISAMAMVSLVFLVNGFPWTGPAWAGLMAFTAVSTALWVRMRATPTLAEVIQDTRRASTTSRAPHVR
jgi:hypothetical protein